VTARRPAAQDEHGEGGAGEHWLLAATLSAAAQTKDERDADAE
jgi:hypothetical protein